MKTYEEWCKDWQEGNYNLYVELLTAIAMMEVNDDLQEMDNVLSVARKQVEESGHSWEELVEKTADER